MHLLLLNTVVDWLPNCNVSKQAISGEGNTIFIRWDMFISRKPVKLIATIK